MNACRTAGYRYFHEWKDLSPGERALLVAHYYINNQVAGRKHEVEQREMKKKAKKGS